MPDLGMPPDRKAAAKQNQKRPRSFDVPLDAQTRPRKRPRIRPEIFDFEPDLGLKPWHFSAELGGGGPLRPAGHYSGLSGP